MTDTKGEKTEAMTSNREAKAEKKDVIRVAVGSKNPVKVNAVRQALHRVLGLSSSLTVEVDVQGFSVPSGIPDQPFGDEETQLGAKNRAESAYKEFKTMNGVFPNLSVGLEGGLEWSSTVLDGNGEDTLWCMAWMAIYGKRTTLLAEHMASTDSKYYTADKKPICGYSKTGTFLLPTALAKSIEDGMELGHADDKVFGRSDSGQKSGTVGKLTDGIIDRTAYYEHALILALVPWIRPDVYSPAKTEAGSKESGGESGFVGSLFCSSRKS